jgi:uncharacterized protein YecE (DUF72 family)
MTAARSLGQPHPAPLIGCAGWGLSSKTAADFPSKGSHLERYANVFPAVEIDSSFYRPHRPATYARWRDSVPDDFRFSVKLPRTVTHECRLADADEPLLQFLAEAGELRHKLGCLLVQLPPSLPFDPDVAGAFFALLRTHAKADVACEPRHASWFTDDAAALLSSHRVACVDADPAPVEGAAPRGFAGMSYIRLHGSPDMYRSSYDAAYIDAVAARIERLCAGGIRTWCVFDNTALGAAVPNALSLRAHFIQH